MSTECSVCERITDIKNGTNPNFVKELGHSYVVIGDHQFYKGYTVVISKMHATELHQLSQEQRDGFLRDMADTAQAMSKAFAPVKLNYELLDNTDSHMHWHIFPRHSDDPNPTQPVWVIPKSTRKADSTLPSTKLLAELKSKLAAELDTL